tara:strand:- start:132 stop:656 length:525 start_codon:yes stop_codon:yes gene_type:complete
MKKNSKNLQRIQDMLDGNYNRKTQVGYETENVSHKVGDIWTDDDGVKWEQKNGYRMKLSVMPNKGIGDQCTDCKKICQNRLDKPTYSRMQRCFNCQISFESRLKRMKIGESNNKWVFWVHLQQMKRWDAMDSEAMAMFEEMNRSSSPFDETVMAAIGNSNVDSTIKVNKKLTGS